MLIQNLLTTSGGYLAWGRGRGGETSKGGLRATTNLHQATPYFTLHYHLEQVQYGGQAHRQGGVRGVT
jgi:hypothetical protein